MKTYNYNLLKMLMADNDYSQKRLSEELGISNSRLSAIFNKKGHFTVENIEKIRKIFDIQTEEIGKYFFKTY